jgi:hypothetical protein
MNKIGVEGYRTWQGNLCVQLDIARGHSLLLSKAEATELRDALNAALLGDGCGTHSQVEPTCYACQENARSGLRAQTQASLAETNETLARMNMHSAGHR